MNSVPHGRKDILLVASSTGRRSTAAGMRDRGLISDEKFLGWPCNTKHLPPAHEGLSRHVVRAREQK